MPLKPCFSVTAGVGGQRAGEEWGHRSRRSPHDPHEADRWYVTSDIHTTLVVLLKLFLPQAVTLSILFAQKVLIHFL